MKKTLCLCLAAALLLAALAGCGAPGAEAPAPASRPPEAAPPTEEAVTIRVGALTGPTAMGMVKLMRDSDEGTSQNSYSFELRSEAAAFGAALAKGEVDVAALPANLAAAIYNNTEGGVCLLAINTLGVLYIVERGEGVRGLADLAGRTLYATGEGAAPEFALRYLLAENGLEGDAGPEIRWCADTTEALAHLHADAGAVAMLPQPFVTAAQAQLADLRVAVDLNAAWEALDNGSAMVTGVLVARSDFAEAHPAQLAAFLEEYEASVRYVQENPAEAAALVGDYGIVPAAIAEAALPYCGITFVAGADMVPMMEGYLRVLEALEPAAIGGALPGAAFYHVA